MMLQNVLTLKNLQLLDAGRWVVVANNSIGESEADIKVNIALEYYKNHHHLRSPFSILRA